jgi:two-component system OmpR family response regulator
MAAVCPPPPERAVNRPFRRRSGRSRYNGAMRVLVVEDEPALAAQLAAALSEAGYAVQTAADGAGADLLASTEAFDAVVLDLGLPHLDGLTLLQRWRGAGLDVPVLVLTARSSWSETVRGIDSGADDYMGKPFRIEEVLARVRALLRRARGHAQPELRCGGIALDPRRATVTLDGAPVILTSHEFRTLAYLMHQDGRVVSRSELTEHIYAQSFDRDSNTVEVFVARLRRKLGAGAIETVRGLGYRMAPLSPAEAPRR